MDMAAVIIQALLLPRTPHLRPAHSLLLEYQKGHGRKMSHTIRAKRGLGYYVLCFFPHTQPSQTFSEQL